MDTSRRRMLALLGLAPATFVSGTAAADPRTSQVNAMPFDAARHKRLQNALAFVKSVNNDLRLHGLPPLDDGYVMRAIGQPGITGDRRLRLADAAPCWGRIAIVMAGSRPTETPARKWCTLSSGPLALWGTVSAHHRVLG
jgi:hypothetical protein